jgi:hypothetical protein
MKGYGYLLKQNFTTAFATIKPLLMLTILQIQYCIPYFYRHQIKGLGQRGTTLK